MIGCPLLVGLSNRIGRLSVLRMCLGGNALAALLTAFAHGYREVAIARVLAGLFAASVPVAQVATADLTPPGAATSKALTRVASAASLGIIAGPAAGGTIAELATRFFGASAAVASRWVFGVSGSFAVIVLLLTAGVRLDPPARSAAAGQATAEASGTAIGGDNAQGSDDALATATTAASPSPAAYTQLLCRWSALVCSFCVVVGIATYALFSLEFLGYAQRQLSLTQSAAAAAALAVQVALLPRLIDGVGEAGACAIGHGVLGVCLASSALIRAQPLHAIVFLLSRVGLAIADSTTAALTAKFSTAERRGRNLALLQSCQSGSRIFSPLLASNLYSASLIGGGSLLMGPAGTLPFVVSGGLALLTAPALPLLLPAHERKAGGDASEDKSA